MPGGVEDDVAIVRLAEPLPGAANDEGAKVAVAPAGNPVAERATDELKLLATVEVIVATPELARAIVIDDADDEIVK